jgi:hypothetical protein
MPWAENVGRFAEQHGSNVQLSAKDSPWEFLRTFEVVGRMPKSQRNVRLMLSAFLRQKSDFVRYPNRFLNLKTLSDKITTPNTNNAAACGQSASIPTPFKNNPRTITKKYRNGIR